MPFLTQGKTNWKYILIVLILAVIVGGGILWWAKRQEVSLPEFPKIKKPEKIGEEKCEDIQDRVQQAKCYTDLAKETENENYCWKIEIPEAAEVRADCYGELAILKNNPSICWEVEIASLASSCWEYFGMKDWKTYTNEEYGYQIKYPKDWIPYKNILGAFDIYKSFYDYNCSVEVYANTERYLYPTEEAEGYFQPFSESKISTEQEPVFIENISGKKLSSPELGGREIYFFEKEIRDNNYYFNIFLDVYKQDPHGEPIIKENRCKDVFKRILSTFQFLPKEKIADNLITEPLCKYRQGEYEMRFYDMQGRMTGVKDGKIKEEIPGSYYIPRDLTPPVEDCPPNCYYIGIPDYIPLHKIEFFGIKEGNYELSASAPAPTWWGELVSFSATNIPIISGLTHVYIFDWELLAKDEEGVVIFIDLDGDGIFEKSITSDNELTCEEFVIQLKKR